MNSTSRETRRLNIKSFFNRSGLWRCYRCCLSCLLLFGQRASPCTFDHLFFRLASLCLEVCLSFVICLNISLPLIQLSRIHPSFEWSLALLTLLLKLLFAIWAASVCVHFRPSVWSVG